MSKAFTKETDQDDESENPEIPTGNIQNYVTPTGFAMLQDEYKRLLFDERPKVVEIVKWAAGNGDRSENGDYIYGKKRLREIDRRIRYLTKRIDTAKVVNPELQKHLTKVFFGATVTYKEKGKKKTVKLVGFDEADLSQHKINWASPLAKALLKTEVGDKIKFRTQDEVIELVILEISY